jgi:ABC-2 type transport system ATP-binding protein
LAFAASIIHQPSLLFLDEPFEGVDPLCAVTMKLILARMNNNGTTVVVTSHNLDLIEKMCTEVAILSGGQIVFRGTMGDVRQGVKNAVTRETYASLEDVFLDVVSNDGRSVQRETPSWI